MRWLVFLKWKRKQRQKGQLIQREGPAPRENTVDANHIALSVSSIAKEVCPWNLFVSIGKFPKVENKTLIVKNTQGYKEPDAGLQGQAR